MPLPSTAPNPDELRAWVRDRMTREGWFRSIARAIRIWREVGHPELATAMIEELRKCT